MCGIFGVLRATSRQSTEANDAVAAAFEMLGRRSVVRGRDSAGFAAVPSTAPATVHVPNREDHSQPSVTIDGTSIVRGLGVFGQVFNAGKHGSMVSLADVVVGHTRAATQGSSTVMNASPLMAGTLIGTHNGDVTPGTIPGHERFAPVPATDSALMFEALNEAGDDLDAMVAVLSAVHGRVALAWVDRVLPGRVYLARAALSPLVTAYDKYGNLWWASVPSWFTDAQAASFGFRDIEFLPEGTLLVLGRDAAGIPTVTDHREFTPTARLSDQRLSQYVWRDFTPQDKALDQALLRHAIVTVPTHQTAAYSDYDMFQPATVPFREAVEMGQPRKAMKRGKQGRLDQRALVSAILTPRRHALHELDEYMTVDRTRTVKRSNAYHDVETYDLNHDPFYDGSDDFDEVSLFTEDEKALIIRDEAREAYLEWVERGCDATVVELIGIMRTAEDAAAIAEEFAFTFDESSWEFQELVNCHTEHEGEMAGEFATA